MKPFLLLLFTGILTVSGLAQSTFPVNGVADNRERVYAFVHATLVVDPTTTIADATLHATAVVGLCADATCFIVKLIIVLRAT